VITASPSLHHLDTLHAILSSFLLGALCANTRETIGLFRTVMAAHLPLTRYANSAATMNSTDLQRAKRNPMLISQNQSAPLQQRPSRGSPNAPLHVDINLRLTQKTEI